MTNNLYAVIIGVNEYSDTRNFPKLHYAEKDAQDIFDTLTNSSISGFAKENTVLLLGKDATTENLEKTLYTEVVNKHRDPDNQDTVVVYFSGHGFIAGEEGKAYLGTHDVMIDETNNPRSGLLMDYLHDAIFMASHAKRIIFLLDCCHSGAFIPPEITGHKDVQKHPIAKEIIDSRFFSNVGPDKDRIALVSSSSLSASLESPQYQNGIFTYYLKKGLNGEAVERIGEEKEEKEECREVTIDSLTAYVKKMMPEQIPGRYGQDFGRFVITKVPKNKLPTRVKFESLTFQQDVLPEDVQFQLLANPLEDVYQFIQTLIGEVDKICLGEGGDNIQGFLLDILRNLFQAEFVFVFGLEGNTPYQKFQSEYDPRCNPEQLIQVAVYLARGLQRNKAAKHQLGILYDYQRLFNKPDKNQNEAILLVPLAQYASENDGRREFIAIAGISSKSPLADDTYAMILKSIYKATFGLNTLTSIQGLEEKILDDLKEKFNHVPAQMYKRRFELFSDRANKLTVYFQPIIYLDPDFLHICGWEALARETDTYQVPNHLFKVAEQWGPQFCIELDQHMVMTAPKLYREALRKINKKRVEDIKDLSINVYSQSLTSTAYFKTVGEAINQKAIPPENMILEISEKSPIPTEEGMDPEVAITNFRMHLKKYLDNYRIRFAIDDFGVENSSIFRLRALSLNYIKVDRSVVATEGAKTTLTNVFKLIKDSRWDSPKIVVEGFDETTMQQITLNELYEIGVRFLQGYMVGRTGPDLYRLDKNLVEKLRNFLGKYESMA